MKMTAGLLAALLLSGPSISFFKYVRTIRPASSSGLCYVVVGEALWQRALPSLGDLRLYSGAREIPYALDIERGSSETERKPVRVLQPAIMRGMRGIIERNPNIVIFTEFAPGHLKRAGVEVGAYIDEIRDLGFSIHSSSLESASGYRRHLTAPGTG